MSTSRNHSEGAPKAPWQFKVLAALLPVLLLAGVEGILRLAEYGVNLSLFIPDPEQPEYLVMNPDVSKRYFVMQENATIGNRERFKAQKAPGVFRIFVLGESTTIGYPYLHNGSFHRWLQYRLMHTYPDQEVEVVNLSLTAVNSYTVQDFASELVHHQPDAVLIYVGHNEYYGALGVGSSSFVAKNPRWVRFMVRLRDLRLVQALDQLVKILKKSPPDSGDSRETLMKRMAAKQQIPLGSEAYHDGIKQFEANLTEVCRRLSEHRIEVYLSDLVSNECDLKPFISDGQGPESADSAYALGQEAYSRGDFETAKAHFVRAKELDMLRFRAPLAMNEVIHRMTKAYPGVHLVETYRHFESRSPHGMLGKETLLEHVHPNLYGYALLSDAFFQSLKTHSLVAWQPQNAWNIDSLVARMPITAVDSFRGHYEIMVLKRGWPFLEEVALPDTTGRQLEARLAASLVTRQVSWGQAMTQLLAFYSRGKRWDQALRVAEAMALADPVTHQLWQQAGTCALKCGQLPKAVFCLRKAYRGAPTPDLAQSLMVTLLKLDRPEAAQPYLRDLLRAKPGDPSLTGLQTFINELISLRAQLQTDPDNAGLRLRIAATYLQFANASAAKPYLDRVAQQVPGHPVLRGLLVQYQTLIHEK